MLQKPGYQADTGVWASSQHHGQGTPSPLLPDPAFLGHCITGLAGQGDGIR